MCGETGAVIGMRDVGSSEIFNTSSYKQAFFFFDEMLKLNNKQTKKPYGRRDLEKVGWRVELSLRL